MKYSDTVALILCAGKGERTGLKYNKIFYPLPEGRTAIERVIDTFSLSEATKILLVINPDDEEKIKKIYDGDYVLGGDIRQQSVKNGLNYIASKGGCDTIVIHDCARPYASVDLINRCIASAKEHGSGIAAVTPIDTVKIRDEEFIKEHLFRKHLVNVQTPQAYDFDKLIFAYESSDIFCTDDSEIFGFRYPAVLVEGEYGNVKLTTSSDLSYKVGNGFDVHPLVEGRKLILGGVEIPHDKGLLGHSDADVLTHAVCDAILSASGLCDIGVFFPDTDDTYKGISSLILLKKVLDEAEKNGYTVVNISAVIMAQKPKLAPHILNIRKSLAENIGIDVENVNVSATTTEKLGIIGQEQGIASSALCLLRKLC